MIHFDLPNKHKQLEELKLSQQSPTFWDDVDKATAISQQAKQIQEQLLTFTNLLKHLQSIAELLTLVDDQATLQELSAELDQCYNSVQHLEVQTLLSGEYDANDAICTLHAGAGGTEAQDWVEMLFRMYSRYVERSEFSMVVLDRLDGEEAGIKSITFQVQGPYAYGYLKAEKGVHRLVRISPFDSNSRRHTSFASLEVIPKINDEQEFQIDEKELRIDTYRSSGAGGQHVNKTDSAIRITHIPTNIVVACQNERSQVQNREKAMEMLKGKLIELKERLREQQLSSIKGEVKRIEWGSQIRSYVFMPYTLVKDHRTGYENTNINQVMDGDIQGFIEDYLYKAY